MTTYTEAERFLQEVFGDDWAEKCFLCMAPDYGVRVRLEDLDPARDCYWCVGAIPQGKARRNENVEDVRTLVIDDVGEKLMDIAVEAALGAPTRSVLTSADNSQWSYRLSAPVPAAEWRGFFTGVEAALKADLDGSDAVHLFRVPMGRNTKKKPDRKNYVVGPGERNPGNRLSVGTIVSGPVSVSSGPGPQGSMSLDELRSWMKLIPNTFDDRDTWIEIGHGLKALCADDEDGFTVFDEWSATHPSYDAVETRRVWDSFGASGLKSKGGQLRARAEALNPSGVAALVFDDGVVPPGPKRAGITATPYQWVDPDKIELRDWLYGKILIRKFISMTVAPGGVGKSSLVAVETLAQVSGKDLLGEKPAGELRVWLWNLEDPGEETTRKIQVAAKHYGITEADIGGRLFVDSGRDQRLVVAVTERNAPTIVRPVIRALVEQIKLHGIDVVVIDPFVSCHEVPENDNTAQDMVVKEWGRVAEEGNCAVHLVDHTRKAPPGTEVTTESSRGGKAKTDAARVVRVVNRMSETQGRTFGVVGPWRYFNTFNDKANMAPPADRRDWFYLESVPLGNGGGAAQAFAVGAGVVQGDDVGVARRWMPPSPQDIVTGANFKAMVEAMNGKEWRKDVQAKEKWIGIAAGEALNLDPKNDRDRASIKEVLETWFRAGLLTEVMQQDENRMTRKFIKITGGF
jgi:hypothetical protein